MDTYAVAELPLTEPVRPDVRDPRTRRYGHIDPENMDPALQTPGALAVSASMRTALLVYSGITVKMMIDSDLGAQLSTMFMVQYEPTGLIGGHDHPFEETYLILDGAVEATFDGASYVLGPGDVGWAGVGCVHSFRPAGDGPVRWLETQAPQPPTRHSYRFARDWDYLRQRLETGETNMITLVVGGTSGLGLEIARNRSKQGDDIVVTGRDQAKAAEVASSLGGNARALAFDLTEPRRIAPVLAGIERVDNVVLVAIDRDTNSVREYDLDRALNLTTLKLVGYIEVVHALLPAMHDDTAVVVFGGRAKDKPYSGSTTVSTVTVASLAW